MPISRFSVRKRTHFPQSKTIMSQRQRDSTRGFARVLLGSDNACLRRNCIVYRAASCCLNLPIRLWNRRDHLPQQSTAFDLARSSAEINVVVPFRCYLV